MEVHYVSKQESSMDQGCVRPSDGFDGRTEPLIERLVRMIDSLEQNEGDPERLSNLFAMDHLVTRMRRNSENLLLLAGHESARKWSDPVPLADVARAAVSEIEQYSRVTMKIQPGIAVTGQAVSDVVHLLAEVIENATIFSAKDTPVHVAAQELSSGGMLIEVSDNGVGIPEARLAEMNWRLDNPPVMDVSVSRHMGLFAVARLAERHGVRVRLRPRSPHGLTALVWLPDSVTEREAGLYGARVRTFATQGPAGTVRGVPGAALAHSNDRPRTTGPRTTAAASSSPITAAPARASRPSQPPLSQTRASQTRACRTRACRTRGRSPAPGRRRRTGSAAGLRPARQAGPPRVTATGRPGSPWARLGSRLASRTAAVRTGTTGGRSAGTRPRSSPSRSGATSRPPGCPRASRRPT